MKEGDFVIDRATGDRLILFSKLSVSSDEWVVDNGKTVWDYNSKYPYSEPSDPVCICIYLASVPFEPLRMDSRERANRLQDMNTEEIEYHFPITRLKKH